ncbi:MAG TPA: hypothetical protein VNG71_01090 [Pyrinomonadaceae bacterium]|nr:hypothetical protein [Pyrinomonadaceae bacterium]
MSLNAKQRAEYLETLKHHGGDKALHAGLDLLKAVDSGKALPKAKVAKGAAAEAKKFSLPGVGKKVFCGLKCLATNNPKTDPAGFALCVFQCVTS